MLLENVKRALDGDSISLRLNDGEAACSISQRKGRVFDYFIDPKTNSRTLVRAMDYNTIVNSCSVLLSCLMSGKAGFTGINYWAVGSGNSSWDSSSIPSPDVNDTKLYMETYRKQITSDNICFLDESDNVTTTPTNKIQISVIFLENEANGALREFGLFGGNATSSTDSGIMINRKTHPVITKTDSIQLERIIKITL